MSDDLKMPLAQLISDSPKLHDWGDGLQSGGLKGEILMTLANYLTDELTPGAFTSLETGAGLSTLVFMGARPGCHIVINPDEPLKHRILEEANRRGFTSEPLDYRLEFSEYVLPDLAKTVELDIALIDGGHGWPTVFVDFCYANVMLREGGIMIVDDIFAFPCMQLFLLLKHQPGWQLEHLIYGKTAFFRKQTSEKLMPDFGQQPYLKNNMLYS